MVPIDSEEVRCYLFNKRDQTKLSGTTQNG